MIAESPTSPRARDRITVAPIHTDTITRLHAEAEATGRSIGDIAADWLDQWRPPTRRVVAVVEGQDFGDGVMHWVVIQASGRWITSHATAALGILGNDFPHARIEQAGAARYEIRLKEAQ